MLKRLAAHLPQHIQTDLRRWIHRRAIMRGRFVTHEPEFALLKHWVRPGDVCVDIGANVGHYTLRLSELVGRGGRVLAIEPIPETVCLLASNVALAPHPNITILNVAASDRACIASMTIPRFASGLNNYYEAHITTESDGPSVIVLPLDGVVPEAKVSLIKVDAEGHDLQVLSGLSRIISTNRPVIIIEDRTDAILDLLAPMGYRRLEFPRSPNVVYLLDDSPMRPTAAD